MLNNKLELIIVVLLLIIPKSNLKSEQSFEYYLSQFYAKQSEATKILKEIESDLKNGSRNNTCSRQKEAASLGLKAIEMLIKAYEISEELTPLETIESNKLIWENLLGECL